MVLVEVVADLVVAPPGEDVKRQEPGRLVGDEILPVAVSHGHLVLVARLKPLELRLQALDLLRCPRHVLLLLRHWCRLYCLEDCLAMAQRPDHVPDREVLRGAGLGDDAGMALAQSPGRPVCRHPGVADAPRLVAVVSDLDPEVARRLAAGSGAATVEPVVRDVLVDADVAGLVAHGVLLAAPACPGHSAPGSG